MTRIEKVMTGIAMTLPVCMTAVAVMVFVTHKDTIHLWDSEKIGVLMMIGATAFFAGALATEISRRSRHAAA